MLQNFINGQLIAQQLHLQFQLDHCIQFITLTVHYTYQFVFLGRDFSNWQLIQVFQNAQLSLTHTHTGTHVHTNIHTRVSQTSVAIKYANLLEELEYNYPLQGIHHQSTGVSHLPATHIHQPLLLLFHCLSFYICIH